MSHYTVRCRKCGNVLKETNGILRGHCDDALLVTEYSEDQFKEKGLNSIWKFNWLPVHDHAFDQPVIGRVSILQFFLKNGDTTHCFSLLIPHDSLLFHIIFDTIIIPMVKFNYRVH